MLESRSRAREQFLVLVGQSLPSAMLDRLQLRLIKLCGFIGSNKRSFVSNDLEECGSELRWLKHIGHRKLGAAGQLTLSGNPYEKGAAGVFLE